MPDRRAAELEQARQAQERLSRQLAAATRSLEDQKHYTLELQQSLDAMFYSRTWQLMLACREALGSFRKLAALPLRVLRILIDQPVAPVPSGEKLAAASALLPQYFPHRRSNLTDWPPDRPLVTIGIPCYNYGIYLREAVASALASTLQDFEILIINDGSTDPETLEVLEELERRPPDPRVRVVHQPNQGLAAARNKGAALGLGKYVVSLDADDRLTPTYLEKAAWVLEHHPEYAFCYSLVRTFGAEECIWKTEPFNLDRLLRQNHVPTGAMFRREVWIEAGGFRDELWGQDDWNFWITLGAKGWDGFLIEEPLFEYRKHAASMWAGLELEKRERTAETVRSLHRYLTGTGDSRAAELFNPPQDPVVRTALDNPKAVPEERQPLAERPHLHFGDGRPGLLFAVPWMDVGGAEQVVLQVMQGLSSQYNLAAVTTLEARHNWEEEFRRVTPWIYHLSRLPLEDAAGCLRDLVRAHRISGLIISSSALAYQALPVVKPETGVWTADIVHNTVPEGYLQTSLRFDQYLDTHFALGQHQRQALIRRGGVAPEKIQMAPTAADASGRFDPAACQGRLGEIRRRLRLTGDEVVVVYTGRLAVEKDVPLFVQVVGELVRRGRGRRFQAFIAGDGPDRPRVEREIRAQGLQGVVEILGFCDWVPELLAAARFALLTSRFEGSSVTLLEAMAMRQAVLTTDTGNAREVIEDGVNGCIVASRDPAAFAARIAELLADPAREAAMRDRARRTILERFDLVAMVRIYSQAIGEALARQRQPA